MHPLQGRKQTPEHVARRAASIKKTIKEKWNGKAFNNALEKWRESGGVVWNKGKNVGGMSGKHHSEETKAKMSRRQKGIPRPNQAGAKHHNWKGGISKHKRDLGSLEYVEWRLLVFERDRFTCQMPSCDQKRQKLEGHHIKDWSRYAQLRFEVSNGITLCKRCHNKTKGKEEKYEQLFVAIVAFGQPAEAL